MEKITFLNQPKFTSDEVDQSRNEKKRDLIPKIEEFVSNHTLFKDKEVNISFAQEGRTSLVAIIEAEGKKYVLKTAVTLSPREGRTFFKSVERRRGVSAASN